MKRLAFCSLFLMAVAPVGVAAALAPAPNSASESAPNTALPAGCKATLHFERTKVAVGAVPDEAHQSEFWIEVRDAKGQPKSGVAVALPQITKGGLGPNHKDKAPDNSIRARLEWLSSTTQIQDPVRPLDIRALTNAEGRARGRFTSGFRKESVEFSVVGGAKATVFQAWNELDKGFDTSYDSEGVPVEQRYTMRFHDGKKWVPITGHRLDLVADKVRFYVLNPDLGEDWDDDGKPDGETEEIEFSEDKPEAEGWKMWLQWWTSEPFIEVEPGVYVSHYQYKVPQGAKLEGRLISHVANVGTQLWDNNAWVGD